MKLSKNMGELVMTLSAFFIIYIIIFLPVTFSVWVMESDKTFLRFLSDGWVNLLGEIIIFFKTRPLW